MPIERMPSKPLPLSFIPPESFPYRVKDGDDWQSVATRFVVPVNNLIYFNFHTLDTDEVNWYLRYRTGCNKPSPDKDNWAFSSSAKPGFVYIPNRVMDMEGDVIEGSLGVRTGLPHPEEMFTHHGPHLIQIILTVIEWGHISMEIAGIELGLGTKIGVMFAGGFAAVASFGAEVMVLFELGSAWQDGRAIAKREQAIKGLAVGVVLGAMNPRPDYRVPRYRLHPDVWTDLVPAYLTGLAAGLAYGKHLNTVQRKALFDEINDIFFKNRRQEAIEFLVDDFDYSKWSGEKLRRYESYAIGIFRGGILQQ